MSLAIPFEQYLTPSPSATFSHQYFGSLTFDRTSELIFSYPTILSKGSVKTWAFSNEFYSMPSATIIEPRETIPHYEDIRGIMDEMPGAYAASARSVRLGLLIPQSRDVWVIHYHFSKFRLIQEVYNHKIPIELSCRLFDHLHSRSILPTTVLQPFGQLSITSPVKGLHSTKFPLWKLGYFLGEEWLQDSVLDGLAEIQYFKAGAMSGPVGTSPPYLFLPTSFMIEARRLFYLEEFRGYSREIQAIRERIQHSNVTQIGFLDYSTNHYCSYVIKAFHSLQHGDSMHGEPANDVLVILDWVFSGLGKDLPASVETGIMDRQGRGDGDGSCAIAAHNFIACEMDPTLQRWRARSSRDFRDNLLRELCLYNYAASETAGYFYDWVEACVVTPSIYTDDATLSHGYNDFNLFRPKINHPIYWFLREYCPVVTLPQARASNISFLLNSSPLRSDPPPVLPILLFPPQLPPPSHSLPRSSPPSPTFVVKSRKHTFTTPTRRQVDRSPSVSIISPSRFKQATVNVSSMRATAQLFSSPKREAPETDFVVTDLKTTYPEVIDLVSPRSTKSEHLASPINLVTPPRNPRFHLQKRDPSTQRHTLRDSSVESMSPILIPDRKPRHGTSISPDISTQHPPSLHASEYQHFPSMQAAIDAVYEEEEALGHKWNKGQTKKSSCGEVQRTTLRCNHYRLPTEQHSMAVDPANRRRGKSNKTDCKAHVNITRDPETEQWRLSVADWVHNHEREIPLGGNASRPPTKEVRAAISTIASTTDLGRSDISKLMKQHPNYDAKHPLEPRQIGNIMNAARREARDRVTALGGNVNAIVTCLRERTDQGWRYHLQIDDHQVVTAIWWQSPLQVELTRRYSDLLIYDDTYNRNNCGYPLGIGIGIDGHGKSRNLWYVIHARENTASFTWILQCHLEIASNPPEVVASDRHASLIHAVEVVMPLSRHIFCLHHLSGNVSANVRNSLGSEFANFSRDFWAAYRAVSPDEFERSYEHLVTRFPAARQYLDEELYPSREQWAWAWVSSIFTAGIRTNGRCEVENRINKTIGGPKKTLFQLFNGLNDRTDGQSAQEMVRVRDSSRQKHENSMESIFQGPLRLCRKYLGPFALNTCYTQMQQSFYYKTEVVQRPEGVRDWNEYCIKVDKELGYDWENGEEKHMINVFSNDNARISVKWLLRLIDGRGLKVKHLLQVTHLGTSASHHLTILSDGRYICDCCMGTNLGIPCRHYFQVLTKVQGMKFNIGLVRPRWYQDPSLDLTTVPTVGLEHCIANAQTKTCLLPSSTVVAPLLSNPFDKLVSQTVSRPTDTMPTRMIHHETQAAMRQITAHIQTREQLDAVLVQVDAIAQSHQDHLRDPPVISRKGRPLTQRLTSALEGRSRGGGTKRPISDVLGAGDRGAAKRQGVRCGVCREVGHNRTTCPVLHR